MAFTAGQRVTAAALNKAIGTLAVQASNQTTSSNGATWISSSSLVIPLEANSKYAVECFILYSSATAADFEFNFSLPSGALMNSSLWGSGSGGGAADSPIFHDFFTTSANAGGAGAGTVMSMIPHGVIFTSGTSGNLTFQFRQLSANASNTTLYAGSWISVRGVV